MTKIIRSELRCLHHLSIPARVLAAFIKRSEGGSAPAKRELLQPLLGLTSDELNIAIGELRLQGFLSRDRDPSTRKQCFVIHPSVLNSSNEFVGKTQFRWPAFHGVYAEKDFRAYTNSLAKYQQ